MIGRRNLLAGLLLAPSLAWSETVYPRSPDGGLSRAPRPRPLPSGADLALAAGLPGQVAFAVIDAASGALRDAWGADRPLPPASTLKALTAAYALDRLGPDRVFRTRVIRAGDMLVLAGGGDPHLDTDGLAKLAAQVAAALGPASRPGRFAVWGGALPRTDRIVAEQAAHLAYNPALSGMILNFNRVYLDWRAGGAGLSLTAQAAAHRPRAMTITAEAADQAPVFTYSADAAREHWRISRAALRRPGSRWLPVRRPELYAGDVFQTLCRAQGLALPAPEVIDSLPPGDEIAGLDSPPLAGILRSMLHFSTNLTAETVGLHASGAATLAASAAAMAGWLRGQGIAGDYAFADHSGLSAANRITPLALARALAGPGRAAGLAGLLKTDPLAEDIGADPAASAAVRAKTGTLNFVSNLAGFAQAPGHPEVAFAIFCSDPARRAGTEGQDQPAGALAWTGRAKRLQRQLVQAWAAQG